MGISFLKKGKEQVTMMAQEEAKQEMRKANRDTSRFYIKLDTGNDPRTITFLDGSLDSDNVFDTPAYYEHQLELNGSWLNWFACTQEQEPCPICEMTIKGKHPYAQAVHLFTIIDHTPYTGKNDKVYENQRKLFVCKRDTLKRLQRIAVKQGGSLEGVTIEVTRIGERSEGVGSDFEFITKSSPAEFAKKYPKIDDKERVPYVYDDIITYRTAAELRKLGFGINGPGTSLGSEDSKAVKDDYSKSL